MSPLLIIFLISFGISLITTSLYKFLTDQKSMREIKSQINDLRKKYRDFKSQPEKALETQKEILKLNTQYMRLSFRPLIFSILPLFIVLSWLQSNYTYRPIFPDETFSIQVLFKKDFVGDVAIDSKTLEILDVKNKTIARFGVWQLKGPEGKHLLEVAFKDKVIPIEVEISKAFKKVVPLFKFKNDLKLIQINYPKLALLKVFGIGIGWFWIYLFFALTFSTLFRKLFKVV